MVTVDLGKLLELGVVAVLVTDLVERLTVGFGSCQFASQQLVEAVDDLVVPLTRVSTRCSRRARDRFTCAVECITSCVLRVVPGEAGIASTGIPFTL